MTVRSAPGGYIYLTRGALAFFGSEAELAAALAHEAAHVAERDYLTGPEFLVSHRIVDGDMSKLSAADRLELLAKLRDDEREADRLAVGYLEAAHYAPRGLTKVIELFAELERRAGGHPVPALLRTHPETKVRLAALASVPESGEWKKDEYLSKIDGLLFAGDPRQGYLFENHYFHPAGGFEIALAPPWRAEILGRDLIGAVPKTSTVLVLSKSSYPSFDETRAAMGSESPPTPRGELQVAFDRVPQDAGLVAHTAIIDSPAGTYVLIVVAPTEDEKSDALEGVLKSLSSIREPAYREVKPLRIRVTKTEHAMTLRAFDAEKPSRTSISTLSLINGMDADEELPAGARVKRVDQ